MNLFKYLWGEIKIELQTLEAAGKLSQGLDLGRFSVEPPRDPAHGDIATNAAMVLAKPAGKNPREIAELLAAALRLHQSVTAATVAGPGFINLKLADSFWRQRLSEVLVAGTSYGDATTG